MSACYATAVEILNYGSVKHWVILCVVHILVALLYIAFPNNWWLKLWGKKYNRKPERIGRDEVLKLFALVPIEALGAVNAYFDSAWLSMLIWCLLAAELVVLYFISRKNEKKDVQHDKIEQEKNSWPPVAE